MTAVRQEPVSALKDSAMIRKITSELAGVRNVDSDK
jgi:hypothetical protein